MERQSAGERAGETEMRERARVAERAGDRGPERER